jgi:hypothetical protein
MLQKFKINNSRVIIDLGKQTVEAQDDMSRGYLLGTNIAIEILINDRNY